MGNIIYDVALAVGGAIRVLPWLECCTVQYVKYAYPHHCNAWFDNQTPTDQTWSCGEYHGGCCDNRCKPEDALPRVTF